MGKALEIVSGFVTAPSTTQTALTMAAGNSLTVRNTAPGTFAWLISCWADEQTAGILRIMSPSMHDNVQNIRVRPVASEIEPLLPMGTKQRLVGQETLTVDLSGSATAGDIESASMLIYYEDLPGVSARLAHWDEIKDRIVNTMTVENTLALGTVGGYSGSEAINAEFDLLRANTDYAILGYICSAECASIRWSGSDFGNLGVGGPGNDVFKQMTSGWFKRLSQETGLPLIPVFNSANKGSVTIDGVQDENGTDVTVNTILVQLSM